MRLKILLLIIILSIENIYSTDKIVIEGKSVYGIKFGDKEKKVIEVLGNYDYMILNEYYTKENILKFCEKYIFPDQSLMVEYDYEDMFLRTYLAENGNVLIYTQPFWHKCLVYIDKGIEVFIDKDDEVVEFILFSEDLRFYICELEDKKYLGKGESSSDNNKDGNITVAVYFLKLKRSGKTLQFKSFEGYLQKSGVYFSDDFYKYKEKNRGRSDIMVDDPERDIDSFYRLNDIHLSNLEKFKKATIEISGENYKMHYSKRTGKLLCVIMISKKIKGLEAPLSITM